MQTDTRLSLEPGSDSPEWLLICAFTQAQIHCTGLLQLQTGQKTQRDFCALHEAQCV